MTRTECDRGDVIDDNPSTVRIPQVSMSGNREDRSDQPVPAILNDEAHLGARGKRMAAETDPPSRGT